MATFAQNPVVLAPGGFGTNHDYSISCTAGNTVVILTQDDTPDITSVTLLGASGTLTLDYTSGVYRVYSYKNLPSGVTGIRITTSGSHTDAQSVVFEGTGQLDFDVGGDMPGDFTDIVSITVTTTAADDLFVARWVAGADTFTPDSGYAGSTVVSGFVAEYNSSALGAAGSETISGTFSAADSRSGYAVAYKSAGGGSSPVLMGQACL